MKSPALLNTMMLAALTLAAMAGCASTDASLQPKAGQVKHMIVCEMKPDAGAVPLINASSRLAKLPEALDIVGVTDASGATSRPGVPDAAKLTYILTFADEAALARTKADPAYRSILDDVLRPNAVSVETKDSIVQNYRVSERHNEETEAATRQRRAAAINQQNDLRARTK